MEKTKKTTDPAEELVEVFLMKDSGRYKNDVFCSVNGVGIMVPRGEKVMIKRKYAEVLKRSLEQANEAASFAESLERASAE